MKIIPDNLNGIYPNPAQSVYGKPVVVFSGHRWTLPILFLAVEKGLVELPAAIVTFDRHRDSLAPLNGSEILKKYRTSDEPFEKLVNIVMKHLSPRNDDWIISGMELGLISDVIQFNSEKEQAESPGKVTLHTDSVDKTHRIFHLGRPVNELSYKGALVDSAHESVSEGLWDCLGWDPSIHSLKEKANKFILDIDLDFFTYAWDKYIFPFNEEIYDGEFQIPCQSSFYEDYLPSEFVCELTRKSSLVTIACEPGFCGGFEKSKKILKDVNNLFFKKEMNIEKIKIDYEEILFE